MNIEVIVINDYDDLEMRKMGTLAKEAGFEPNINNTRMIRESAGELS